MKDRLVILNSDDTILRNQELFFSSIGPHPALIASRILEGALVLGCKDASAHLVDDWWLIAASSDWLSAPTRGGSNPDNAFDTTWALPELGANCPRGEALARVFASVTITSTPEYIRVVKGSNSLVRDYETAVSTLPYAARVVGFKFSHGA